MKNFKAGHFVSRMGYKAFQPERINHAYTLEDPELLLLHEEATLKLGELSAYSELVPNIDHFIRLHVVKEATVSSRIEGTQTNIEEALLNEDDIDPERRDDWREVNNYIRAMNQSLSDLSTLPLSTRLLKRAHQTLLDGVRGEHKLPGEFRRSQNWIGGATLQDAIFIPPIWQEVEPLMGDLENFLHNQATGLPYVFRIALAHYQFETIHPFLDGNGRIGRLLITLYFVDAGVLRKPVLYLSDFFEKNRASYYDNLTRVRIHHDITQWLRFFLVGVRDTSTMAIEGLRSILSLKKDCEENRISTLGKKMHHGKILFDYLLDYPIIRPEKVAEITGLSQVSAYKLIEDFERLKILKEMTGARRNRIFAFEEYFNIFKK
ncbi:MAG: Fic family protein [Saprospiraceae bacterium]|nr:Fic family protein [Saprospiraceae bacterium]